MRFHKKVSTESREFLSELLKEYEHNTPMTSEERKELRKWVAAGNSPYENGDYIYGEHGGLVDFVSALRFMDGLLEWFKSLTWEEQQEEMSLEPDERDSGIDTVKYNFTTDEELEAVNNSVSMEIKSFR